MASIKVLEKHVIDHIRSAFVIPSLSQCMLELIHNGLDAKAAHIEVSISVDKSFISVIDNGTGMNWHDLQYVGTRYATSKSLENGQAMTFGYRGEALSSISQISEITVTSRKFDSLVAHSKRIRYGEYISDDSISSMRLEKHGTHVVISGLFGNIPVRQKSCKKDDEWVSIIRNIEALAIACPSISFKLLDADSANRIIFTFKPYSSLEALLAIYYPHLDKQGLDITNIRLDRDDMTIHGFIIANIAHDKYMQFILVNKRLIVSKEIQDIVNLGFRKDMRQCAYLIEFYIPYSDIDFHLEPAKSLVHFKKFDKVKKLLQDALNGCYNSSETRQIDDPCKKQIASVIKYPYQSRLLRVSEKVMRKEDSIPFDLPEKQVKRIQMDRSNILDQYRTNLDISDFEDIKIISQLDNKFIVCKLVLKRGKENVIVLIDQHAADERVRLEKIWINLVTNHKSDTILISKKLKYPVNFKKSSRNVEILHLKKYVFSMWGIVFELKPDSIEITHLPEFVHEMGSKNIDWINELIETFLTALQEKRTIPVSQKLLLSLKHIREKAQMDNDDLNLIFELMTICPQKLFEQLQYRACRGAIMFGDELTDKQCMLLIKELSRCQFPFQCAHGRPSAIPIVILS